MAGNHKQIKPNTMTQTQTTKQTIEQIINLINEMDNSDLVQLNNEYCQSAHYFDSEIFENDEDFFQTFFDIVVQLQEDMIYHHSMYLTLIELDIKKN